MANTKVQSEQIQDGSITADKIADGAIVATELADNAVTTAKINADAVTGAKIADDAIDSEHYTDGSIDTAHIADSQITVAKMAANSVDSDQYVDGSIDTVHIGDSQVTTAKIANGNISTAKIADNAVTSAKLDTNIDIAGTLDVTGATTLDAGLTVDTTTLVVDATNNRVGIGTASPSALLHLSSADPIIKFTDTAGGDDFGIFASASDYLGFFNFSDTRTDMVIDGSGNVGIATTSPAQKLEILDTSNAKIRFAYSSAIYGEIGRKSDGNYEFSAYENGANLIFGTSTTNGATTEAMRIDSARRLLIGETSNNDGAAVQIDANNAGSTVYSLRIENSNTATDVYNGIRLIQGASGSAVGVMATGGSTTGNVHYRNVFHVGTQNATSLVLGTDDTERMRINTSGQLLLGTTSNNSDSYKMIADLGGGSKGIDVRGVSYNADNGAFRSVPSGNTSYRFAVMYNSSNQTVGKIEVTSNSTTYTTSSDYRLKENVTPLENGLDRLNQLKPVKFNWIESGQEEEGFIAHEVDEIFSDAVTGEKDAVKDDGTVSPQTMDYGRITPLLVKAIQEQQTVIEDLKARIEALES